jgi:pimeloyl-ACP methyl ester carboxylesterase
MSMIWRVLLLLLLGYLVLVLYMYLSQARIIYFPRKEIIYTPRDIGLPFREIFLETADGLRICAWFVGEEEQVEKPVLLFCHGNAGNISHRLDSFEIFHRLGLNTFIFDYRGYGKSEGKPSEQGTYLDAAAAWDYLTKNKKIPPQRIILFGRSLGGAVAAHLAASPGITPRVLILESTFTSVPDLGADIYPFLPVRLLSRFGYDTKELLPRIHCPLLIIHSPQDEIIPYDHGTRLFEIANEPKHFLKISGSHNEGFTLSGETYIDGLKAFLEKPGIH